VFNQNTDVVENTLFSSIHIAGYMICEELLKYNPFLKFCSLFYNFYMGFLPFRRNVDFAPSHETPIRPADRSSIIHKRQGEMGCPVSLRHDRDQRGGFSADGGGDEGAGLIDCEFLPRLNRVGGEVLSNEMIEYPSL
jgi:hypothetical protein